MESQYEKLSAPRTHYNKAYIDFYRTSQQHLDEMGREAMNVQGNAYNYQVNYNIEVDPILFNDHMNPQTKNIEQTNSGQERQVQDMRLNQRKGTENRRLSQEKCTTRTQQIGKEQIQQRQIENNGRNLGGAKSALNDYGITGTQQQNQKPKNQIEKQILADNHYQASGVGNYQQKTMAKSQSQNKILFASPESFSMKNQQISSTKEGGNQQDKISFFKDKQQLDKRGMPSTGQEVLFKQHQQYSTGTNAHRGSGAYQLKQSNHHVLSHCSTKECTFCKTQGLHSHSLGAAPCQAIYCRQNELEIMMSNQLSQKYSSNRDYYNVKIINDLIYNENTHVVSIFKDYLILDDINEFLKRTYNYQETKLRLPKLCSFYDKYSQVFPNFVVLPESKYMFKNIQRKQKLIDEQYQLQEELARKQHQTLLDEDKLFNSNFYNSVYKMDLSMTRQQYEEQAKQICTQVGKKPNQGLYGKIEDMKIEDLVDRFLIRDSESNIQLMTTAGLDFSGFTQSNITYEKTPNKNSDKFPSNSHNKNQKEIQGKKATNQPLFKRNQPEMIQKKIIAPTNNNQIAQAISTNNSKKQRGSFNNNNNNKGGATTKLEVSKNTQPNQDTNGSAKTTPRLQKKTTYTTVGAQDKLMTASPDTKQAVNSYLQNCQIEDQNQQVQVLDSTLKYGEMYESPNVKSPQNTQQYNNLLASGSQTSLSHQHGNMTSSLAMNRQQMKSQASLPNTNLAQTQQISNLKKNQRLSTGDHQKHPHLKKAVSPVPTNLCTSSASQYSQQNQVGSRNQGGQNSTQKSLKQMNSHAKYLSGGNEYYQKMLNNNNQQTYATQETINSGGGSSNKKHLSSKMGNFGQMDLIREHQEKVDDNSDHDIITGDDCEEEGIADERLGSPDPFQTEDAGRKSIEGRQFLNGQQMNQFLLTSSDDKLMLSQYTNYDQIKKHLEKYITTQQQQSVDTNNTQTSASKKINFNKSAKKVKEHEHTRSGSNRNQIVVSASGSIVNENNSSRNGATQKHFESLKQKIRGVFDTGETVQDHGNKTPNKSSTHSNKKSQGMNQQNTRMSIEAKDMMLNTHHNIQPCLSSTSAAGRTLSFSQTGFANPNNYRSITNLQQRKGSTNLKERSLNNDSKRLSQNRQSFKEVEQCQQKIIKRCATGKALSINEVHHHTFGGTQQPGFLNSVASNATLLNPTFISSTSNQANRIYQTQQQQQAANTVRVMTPSYSLASLSKMVTPTTSTSPITMTVTLAGSNQSRKQDPKRSNAHTLSHQQNPLMGNSSQQQQTFLLSDKNNKIISSQKNQNIISNSSKSSKIAAKGSGMMTNSINNKSKQSSTTLQQSNSQATLQITPRALVSQQDLNQNRQKNEFIIQESSQNLSCTISTENNSAAKTLESKHPKFMRTIEEIGGPQTTTSYNNILSSSLGYKRSTHGLATSSSQSHFDLKTRAKIQTTTNSSQATTSKKTGITLATSASVSHFKSPSQQIQTKKQAQGGKYQHF